MPTHKNVVLVVEDHPIIRSAALDFLESAGFEVIEASCADEAIRVLESRPEIHLVFTDVEMPGSIDGLKLSHYIKDRWPPIKLIVVSGRTFVEQGHLPLGARFFPKPYNENAIIEAMRRMLSETD
ncbi:response regulator [Hyphomicrobium facile]|uniref:Response regulator receiver domain-containing protein n=1 Tax=Hyphomicrobium facile TaxID=51670 RepID=A0A1I7NHG9_9HYPH|nr:response regulator [Hyphomicrobium facile]SFV34117.1 Response regulator receiver domain-containing protein [Hyphomicrobium facile]